ncbi:MAG: class I SAM-dependent methyltransferase [Candidatus Hydrogenedentes bacterium]|nr:class I SAM-dependent methyltransferase [Candidatus Hydrogenedentota bacterium]
MSESSPNSSGKPTLEIDEAEWLARIGPKRHRLLCLWTKDVVGSMDAAIGKHIMPDSVALDAGCSRGEQDLPSILRAGHTVGCDVDMAGLRANRLERDRVAATLDALPFPDATFHVIASKWVVEHLNNPVTTFREWWRVLRPGGVAAILTPNAMSVFGLVSRVIPHGVKQWVKERLFGGLKEDTFPTPYAANTPSRLNAAMAAAGFVPLEFHMLAGMWAFFIFSDPIARMVRALERVQSGTPGLRATSAHMLGVWQKPLMAESH